MRRAAIFLAALALLCCGLVATDRQAGGADKPKPLPYVIVDPGDLRQPIADPELGLTEKYDGKLVRFTGSVRRWTLARGAKQYTYELQHDIVRVVAVKGKKPQRVRDETIVVPVTFRGDDRQLRARKAGYTLTVEGTGAVLTDGTLLINDAVVIPPPPSVRPLPKK